MTLSGPKNQLILLRIASRIQRPAKFWQYIIQMKSHAADLLYAVCLNGN